MSRLLRRARREPDRRAAGRRRSALDGVEVVVDDPPLSPAALDALDGVLTGCALAIAETGTIVLDGGERSGRRALTLVPDWHICVVEEADDRGGGAGRGRAAGAGAPRRAVRSRSCPVRRPPRTSSSTGSRACTARARSTW